LTGGEPLKQRPKIFYGNEVLHEEYVLQSSYPVFLKTTKEGSKGFICIGIAFRYKGGKEISVFSPFF